VRELVRGWRTGWRRGCGWRCGGRGVRQRGFGEARIIDLRIDFKLFGGESLLDVSAWTALVDSERVFQTLDLVEVREKRLPGKVLASGLADAFPLQK